METKYFKCAISKSAQVKIVDITRNIRNESDWDRVKHQWEGEWSSERFIDHEEDVLLIYIQVDITNHFDLVNGSKSTTYTFK